MTLDALKGKTFDFLSGFLVPSKDTKDTTEFRRIATGFYNRGKIGQYDYKAMIEKYTGWVYAAIKTISADIAAADLQIIEEKSDDTEIEIKNHDFLNLWKKPNPEFTRRFLYRLQQIYMELTGQAYWYFILSGLNKPVEIWSLMPSNIQPRVDEDGKVIDYEFRPTAKGKKVYIPKEYILHEKEPNPINPVMGYSTLFAANNPILLMDKMGTYHERLFQRMARPDVILHTKNGETLTPKARERIAESWLQAHGGGADNAFNKPAVLEGGLEAQIFSTSPKDLEFKEGYKMVLDEIIACYGVTLDLLGITKDVNKANAFALELSYQRNTVMPKLKDKAEWLTQFVLHRYYKNTQNMRCEFKSTIPVDREVKLKEHKGLVTAAIETPNEARKAYHLPPDPDGNQRLVPLNMVGSGSAVTGQGRPPSASVAPPKETKSLMTKTERLAYWKRFVNRRNLYEQQYRNTLKKIFKKYEKKLIANIRDLHRKWLKGVEWLTPPEEAFIEEIEGVSKLFIKQAIVIGGNNIVQDFNLPIDFSTVDLRTGQYMETRINLIRDSMRNSLDDIKKVLQQGLDEGLTTDEMAELVKDKFSQLSEYRSRLISRTEINSAENEGHLMAMTQADVKQKMWVTAGDVKVREEHISMDGEIVSVSEFFSNGLMYPCEPNCRCAMVPA